MGLLVTLFLVCLLIGMNITLWNSLHKARLKNTEIESKFPKFKEYTHGILDSLDIDTHEDKECRIKDRMKDLYDHVIAIRRTYDKAAKRVSDQRKDILSLTEDRDNHLKNSRDLQIKLDKANKENQDAWAEANKWRRLYTEANRRLEQHQSINPVPDDFGEIKNDNFHAPGTRRGLAGGASELKREAEPAKRAGN